MAPYHITIVRPAEYPHSSCFHEVAEGLYYALEEMGHTVKFAENWIDADATTIVLGAHLLTEQQAAALPASVVVFNLEQLGFSWTPPWYMQLAARVHIWDFTQAHIQLWKRVPCLAPPRLVEIGYVPQLSRIMPTTPQDIDVLFYGSLTDRRRIVLEQLQRAGVAVQTVFGVYGAERDALIARSRVVLNLHAADSQVFEIVRVSYLLANRKAVVSEVSLDAGTLTDAVASCSFETAVEVCLRLLGNETERHELENRGFRLFSARSQAALLVEAIDAATQM